MWSRCLCFAPVDISNLPSDDSKLEYCAGVFFSCRPCPRALTLLEIIRDGVYNAGCTSLTPISILAGRTYNSLPSSWHFHQSRDAIKTKITVQCNQWRTRCFFFQIKTRVRDYQSKTIVLPRAGSATEIVSRLPNAKCAATFEDRDQLRKICDSRLSVAGISVFSRSCAHMHVTYSFEYQNFDICQERKLLPFIVFASWQKTLRKIEVKSDKFSSNLA